MFNLLITLFYKIAAPFLVLWRKFNEAIFITSHQYRLRFLYCQKSKKHQQVIAFIQVIIKRIKIKLSMRYLASNKALMRDIHPVDTCRIAFISCFENNNIALDKLPDHIKSHHCSCPIIKQLPTLKIKSQYFDYQTNKTIFTIRSANTAKDIVIPAEELAKNHDLLYGLGSLSTMTVGFSAAEDLLRTDASIADINKDITLENTSNSKAGTSNHLCFYHVLCVIYVGLSLAGISIVRRMFPFHIPGSEFIVHFGAGVIFFPLTFAIQDITTEVYGYSYSRQMVWLTIMMLLFYVLYTQIAISLPIGTGHIYDNTSAFATVYSTVPRQLISLIVSMLAGNLINDFFISKSKMIFAGQYLWARLLGSTMIGEAVSQIIGMLIGFSDTLDFYTQILPNMTLAYGYKQLWNAAMIPVIYMITNYLKKKEGVDVYDYDVNYSPFSLKLTKIK